MCADTMKPKVRPRFCTQKSLHIRSQENGDFLLVLSVLSSDNSVEDIDPTLHHALRTTNRTIPEFAKSPTIFILLHSFGTMITSFDR